MREEGRERSNWVRSRGEIAWRRQRRDRAALELIFAWSAWCCDRRDQCDRRGVGCGLELNLWSLDWSLVCSCSPFLSLSFFARLKLGLKMVWSENENRKCFTPWVPYFTVNTKNIFNLTQFSEPTKHIILRKSISKISLKPKQTDPKSKKRTFKIKITCRK